MHSSLFYEAGLRELLLGLHSLVRVFLSVIANDRKFEVLTLEGVVKRPKKGTPKEPITLSIIRITVRPPKNKIDCIAWKRTKRFCFSIKKKMRPVTQPKT